MARSIGATPAAILAGSVIIAGGLACGLYFGLRARPVVVIAPPSSTGEAAPVVGAVGAVTSAPAVGTSLSTTPGRDTPPAPIVQAQLAGASPAGPPEVNRDVLAALEKQRSVLVRSCWTPATTGPAKPASATYDFDLAFNEAGHEVARGISGREGSSTDLTQCLYKNSPALDIPAHGTRLHSRVRFTLP